MRYTPEIYQDFSTKHAIDNPFCGLLLDMGLGKTIATLTAIDQLMFDMLEIQKVLVVAPKKVAESTWPEEIEKWDHTKKFRYSLVLGSETQRKMALKQKADIYIINRENLVWLKSYLGGAWPFDMVVIDELSSFKSHKSARFKAMKTVRPLIKRLIGLTGTPAPNTLMDLWPQMYLLDMGERLGNTITGYRTRYFRLDPYTNKYQVLKEEDPLVGEDYYERKIYSKIGDICISMKKEDWLDLPERINRTISVKLSSETRASYLEFEREQVLALPTEETITAVNAAALTTKLLQFANGAVYTEQKTYYEVHDQKLEALEEIIDTAAGHPVLVFYSFRHDLERIKKHLKAYKPKELDGPADVEAWNKKQIPVLLAHPASAGHGLNMQAGGNIIVWFGLPWSLELYQQANARLDRKGQTQSVIVHHLVSKGTMDEDVMEALARKADNQEALMQAVKARIQKYRQITAA